MNKWLALLLLLLVFAVLVAIVYAIAGTNMAILVGGLALVVFIAFNGDG